MSDIAIPIFLSSIGVILAFLAYRGILKGGARFYTLEREQILRRASTTLLASVFFFIGAVGLLAYQYQEVVAPEEEVNADETPSAESVVTVTPTPELQIFPPEPTLTPTEDPNLPTPTATVVVCRAVVDGTQGNGLTLRDVPGGSEVDVLADGTLLTLLDDEPTEANGFIWRKVRLIGGDEGWVAQDFITVRAPCQ